MPTLDWIGKSKVVNHHLEVPYHVLERTYSFDENGKHEEDNGSQNMIIHGDNLVALKALLPKYEGRIKCIYIDPPYNTGNEGWIYNDNVNDPQIKQWLGQVVGKEGDDLSRHDKWLCMMYPRLRLLERLLSEDGAIFISIDDNELYNLKAICDEIFGNNCFVADISWQRTYSMRNDAKGIPAEVEHILIYSKKVAWQPHKLERTESMNAKYKNIDNDPKGAWRNIVASAPNALTHQGMVYAIQNPLTGKLCYPPQGRCWSLGQDQMLTAMNNWCPYKLSLLDDKKQRASICGVSENEVKPDVKGIVIDIPLDKSSMIAANIYKNGVLPEFFFSKNGQGTLSRKAYLSTMGGKPVTNFWPFSETGHTDEASRLLKDIFNGKAVFDTPKPPRLIERILKIATDPNSIILDSFAGSGTTAHAVLNMNKEDGGHRNFILIEMGDYADSITAERVKRVIHGYGKGKNTVEGTGGDFNYYELGDSIVKDGNINPNVDINEVRKLAYYLETKQQVLPIKATDKYLLGMYAGCAYYFFYEKNQKFTLNRRLLSYIQTKAESYVIYADTCTLSESALERYNITFKKIPGDLLQM